VPQKDPSSEKRAGTIAVALRYAPGEMAAPKIVASGRGEIAQRILELAQQHGIKVRADADLAELLIAVDVGEQIPIAAFAAVAEILMYIYRANKQSPRPGVKP